MTSTGRKRTVIFGCGQIGQKLAMLLGADYQIVCFADNAPEKWNQYCHNIPIFSPAESLKLKPEMIALGVLDQERQMQMRRQLQELDYRGEFLEAACLQTYDNRAAVMRMLAEQIHQAHIPGDVAELGVYQGDFALLLHEAFPDRTLHLFDTFEGFHPQDVAVEHSLTSSRAREGDFSETSTEMVLSRLGHTEQVLIHKGWFPATFRETSQAVFCLVSLDADLYAPTAAALPLFYEQLAPGGVLLIHDVFSTQFPGCRQAVDEFCRKREILPIPVCDLHGSAIIRKQCAITANTR